jgi:hypothetical protein
MSAINSVSSGALSSVRKNNIAATGSLALSLFGAMFGTIPFSSLASIGFSCSEASNWVSDTSIQSLASASATSSQRVSYSVGSRQGSLTEALSIITAICTVSLANSMASGSAYLTLVGSNLGMESLTGSVRRALTVCERSFWIAETAVVCTSAPALGHSQRFTFSQGSILGSRSEVISLDLPTLSCVFPRNVAATGSSSVTIVGSNFGFRAYTITVSNMLSVCEATKWTSDSAVGCLSISSGVSSRLLSASVAQLINSVSQVWSTDRSMVSNTIRINCASTGSLSLTLIGSFYSVFDLSSSLRAQTSFEATTWISDTSVCSRFHIADSFSKRASLTSGQLISTGSGILSFDTSQLGPAQSSNFRASSSTSKLLGSGFVVLNFSPKGGMGGTNCELTFWESASSISCIISQGSSRSRYMTFSVGSRQPATVSNTFSFNEPFLWTAALAR